MKAIYKLQFSCGRQGTLYGIFVEKVERVEELIASKEEIYFGEVMGKHSEVIGPLDETDIVLITTDETAIAVFEEHNLETGYNPFDYL